MRLPTSVRGLLAVLALALMAGFGTVEAQETGRITGTVTSASNMRPLEGAQVSIEGTGMGALANAQGRYLILNVPAGQHTVRVTMIGYGPLTREVTVQPGQAATVDFQLSETALALDEIVVTGTAAEVRAKEVGNSLDAITSREIENVPLNNATDVLQGRAPGVTVLTNSGQAGAGGTVKIRGLTSVTQTIEPLIYVDGIRIFHLPTRSGWDSRTQTNPLQDIAAEDIERIEVVKGASATTLYGTEAAGGVIQIFTKKGISGDPIWTAEVGLGASVMNQWQTDAEDDPSDLFTRCDMLDEMYSLDIQKSPDTEGFGERIYFWDPTCPEDGDWQETGLQQNYSLSVRGGFGDVTYYLSGNFNDNQGILPTSASKDGGFRGNFGFSPMDDLSFQLNTSYTRRNARWVADGNNADGFLLNVGRGAKNYLKDGKGEDCLNAPSAPNGTERQCVTNGYVFDADLTTEINHFITGFTTQWNPLESLSNRVSVGWDYLDNKGSTVLPFGHLRVPEGYFWDENTRHTKLSLDYAGSFQNNFGDDLASTFSWGGQIFRDKHRWTEWDVERFAGPGDPTIESGAEVTYREEVNITNTSAGFFLQELLGWQDRLFLTGGLRVDGNSAFGDDYGLQFYPKVSVAYILSDYDFWPSDWIETFKLRGAMGESGKAPSAFAKLRTWSGVGLAGSPGFTPGDPGNADVGPERTREYEVGFDASLWQGRLGVEATYYDATTTDALINVDLPASEGFLVNRTANVGETSSEGWEFQITGGLLRTDMIDWRMRANLTFMDSKAVDLDGDPDVETCLFADGDAELCEGEFLPVYTGARVMNPDEFAAPIVNNDTIIGPGYPTRMIGLGTTLNIGNSLTIDGLVEHQGGHYLPNWTGYQNARRGSNAECFDIQQAYIDNWFGRPNNLDSYTALWRARCVVEQATDFDGDGNFDLPKDDEFWIEEADFWKIRHVTLSWDVPESLVDFGRSATVSLSARNLFTWTDYSGTDPEVSDFADLGESFYDGDGDFGRRDYYQIPPPRTYSLAVRLSW